MLLYATAILTTLTSLTHALAQCYLRNGSLAPPQYSPCSTSATGQDGSHTQCCDWVNGDICLSSGLCLYPPGGVVGMLNADGCTDQTMQDASCQTFCSGVSSGAQGYLRVVPCEDGTWCCTTGYDASCCEDSATFTLDGLGTVMNMTKAGAVVAATETVTMSAMGTRTVTVVQGSGTSTTVTSTAARSANASASGQPQVASTNGGQIVGGVVSSVLLGGFLVALFVAIQ